MPASSNFNQAIREAQTSSIVGPNVVQKALPYVGGGMVLTSLGVLAGVSLIATNPGLFQPLSIVALIAELILFFIATSAANNANNAKALPLLTGNSCFSNRNNWYWFCWNSCLSYRYNFRYCLLYWPKNE